MSQNTFDVVFTGKLVEGAAQEKVKANVAALFKVEVAKVERLFAGGAVPIKKGVDEAMAKRYQVALQKAGAICRVIDRSAPAQKAPPPPVAKRQQGGPEGESVGLQKSVVKAPPQDLGEFDTASVDAPGVTLIEHEEVPPPQIDTSGFSLDQPGAVLAEHEPVPEPQLDTSGLSLGEEGEALGSETPFVPLEVDTSEMSMDEPGITLVEHEEVPEPEIDTSELSLKEGE